MGATGHQCADSGRRGVVANARGDRNCATGPSFQLNKGPRQQDRQPCFSVGALDGERESKDVGKQRAVVQRRTGGLYS
jgi:hypothetical protein